MARLILPSSVLNAAQEQHRLDALAKYEILDTPAEPMFDGLTRLAKQVFNVSMSSLTFIDGHRQWFKSRQGLAACETDRGPALCYAAIQQTKPLVVTNASTDERFHDNVFVVGEPHIRFYAGFPVRSPEGQALGTLCVMDDNPRPFSTGDEQLLVEFGGLATDMLELRRRAMAADGRTRGTSEGTPMLTAGQIIFNNGKSMIDCTVRALTRSAAGVDVIDPGGVPDRVALTVASAGLSRLCNVISRAERRVELTFES